MPTTLDMDRRHFLRLGAAAGTALGLPSFGAPGGQPPNVLFVITDQQHYSTIAAAGCPYVQTPAMDRLVRTGTRFAISYCTNPLCSPARSSMFTGRPSSEAGVHVNDRPIRAGVPTLGEILGAAGYDCVYAGKWHLPATHSTDIHGFNVLTTALVGQGNCGDTFTARACAAYLRNRSRSQPFCMVASFMQPHDICEWLRLNSNPLAALPYPELRDQLPPLPANFRYDPREPEAISGRRKGNEGLANHWSEEQWRYYIWSYYRHVEMVDAEIGRVLQAVDAGGYADTTLVVFTADHGEGLGHHQTTRKNCLYDEASRVPLIFSLPGQIRTNVLNSDRVVSGLDILPTVCAFTGVKAPADVRGHALQGLLSGGTSPGGDFCVSEVLDNRGRMVRTRRHKLIVYRDDPALQLFDMENDPGEQHNLAGEPGQAATVAELRALLRQWESGLDVAPGVTAPDYWRT